jgi:Zn-dependent protease with chaperone function
MNLVEAIYHDGAFAKTHEVKIEFGSKGLTISGSDPVGELVWLWDDLIEVGKQRHQNVAVLTSKNSPTSRLRIDESLMSKNQIGCIDDLQRTKGHNRRAVLRRGLVLSAVLGVSVIFATVPVLTYGLVRAAPISWARSVGANFVDQASRGDEWCEGIEGQRVLDKVLAELAVAAGAPFELSVKVLDDPSVNAFAAPGGNLVILRGLIDEAQSGDEIVAVLAHEVGHAIHRHPTSSILRAIGLAPISRGLIGRGPGATAAERFARLAYSRRQEAQADGTAIALMASAGIDPSGLGSFFQRLANDEERTFPDFFYSHPPSDQRAAFADEASKGDPLVGDAGLSAESFRHLKQMCPANG